jgi:peptidoglycan/LPS O-acetylase OafA/YrhL
MGCLRTFLALSVVLIHSGPLLGLRGVPGDLALQTFFMISGFYMTLILTRKYVGPASVRQFAWNRFLRLFPLYWIVALATLAYLLVAPANGCDQSLAERHCYVGYDFFERYSQLEAAPFLYLVFSNLSMVGLDAALFLEFDEGLSALRFSSDFARSPVPVYSLLLVPQGWSLSVELAFYLAAPVLVRRGIPAVLGVLIASLLLRWGIYEAVGARDPWTYRFFPTELALFAAGVLSCKVYLRYVRTLPASPALAVAILFLALSFVYQWWRLPGDKWTYLVVASVALPFLFRATRDSKLDSMIGDLSYPVYLVHLLVIAVAIPLVAGTEWERHLSWVVVPATFLFASILWLLVGRPIEAWRHRPIADRAVS